LLLDEVAAHLDQLRLKALFAMLTDMETQFWLTGTDSRLFQSLTPNGQFFDVRDGVIVV
jgi:DNA replication and repair protein RecF